MAILGKDRQDEWEAIYEGVEGLSMLYEADPETRRRVEDAVRAFVHGAKKVPGVTIGFGDMKF